MGSAVSKPLTGWRGKAKVDKVAGNSVVRSNEVNANDSCHPSVDCMGNSVVRSNEVNANDSGHPSVDCMGNSFGDNVKEFPEPSDGELAASMARDISQDGVTNNSLKEPTVTIPRNNSAKTKNKNRIIAASSANARKGLSILNRCFSSNLCPTLSTKLSSKYPTESSKYERSQIILEAPTERNNSRETLLNSSGNIAEVADNTLDVDINSTAALAVHTNGLSPDQIGNLRKQLYAEGFNPAEREGGVAFFIPVTEDGVPQQTDRTTVAERLTKKKRASLSYEERMMLANINRQTQLFKRKEFAVRDIRNVVVAASATDIVDKTKQEDGANADPDASALNAINIGSDLNICCTRKAANDLEHEVWVKKKANNDADFEASLFKKATSDAKFEASVIKKATNDAEFEASFTKKVSSDSQFEASFTKKVSSDAQFEASFTKKVSSDAEFEASSVKKATSDAGFEASVAKNATNVVDFDASDLNNPFFDAEHISFTGEEG